MSKRIFGLLLVVCLVVGLLPVVASAATPADATLKFGFSSLKLTDYDKPVYTINYEKAEAKDNAGNTFVAYGQTTSGATEENYNAKYEWKSGEEAPTLTLRNFKFDEYNNETEKLIGKVEDGEYTTTAVQTYTITTSKNVPTKIILEGENIIEAKFGITYYNDLTIESKDNGKLKMIGVSSCIASNNTEGADLTINANLDLTLGSYYNTQYAGAVIHTYKADLTINGGTIKCKILQEDAKSPVGISARAGGNVTINGGTITATSIVGAGATNGCIAAPAGKLIFNGGTTNANPQRAVGLYAKQGIEFNGGTVNVLSPYYGINVGSKEEPATVEFKGGTLNIMAERCFYGGVVLNVADGVMPYVGPNQKDAELYDGTDLTVLQKPWARITNDPEQFIEIKPEETEPVITLPPIAQPSDPVTDPTAAPTTAPTTAPTAAATTATNATNAANGNAGTNTTDDTTESGNNTVIIIVIAAVVVVGAAALVLILKKKK